MIAVGIHAQCEYRRVLEEPDLIGRIRATLVGEALHGAPGWLVLHPAEIAKDMRRRRTTLGYEAGVIEAGVVAIQRLLRAIAGAHQRPGNTLEKAPGQSALRGSDRTPRA